ncbi:hypothetical protein SNEBB_005464 [Seison nebaliae]|nr:hypothetical protein SNEBB_005464 [Seison nebaliae]
MASGNEWYNKTGLNEHGKPIIPSLNLDSHTYHNDTTLTNNNNNNNSYFTDKEDNQEQYQPNEKRIDKVEEQNSSSNYSSSLPPSPPIFSYYDSQTIGQSNVAVMNENELETDENFPRLRRNTHSGAAIEGIIGTDPNLYSDNVILNENDEEFDTNLIEEEGSRVRLLPTEVIDYDLDLDKSKTHKSYRYHNNLNVNNNNNNLNLNTNNNNNNMIHLNQNNNLVNNLNNEKFVKQFNKSPLMSSTSDVNVPNPANHTRPEWNNHLDFIFTCISYGVGLGNVWRFPYLCFTYGGGAFLLIFLLLMIIVGIPINFLELALGQFSSQGPVNVWKLAPLFRGLGIAALICNGIIGLYYNVIICYSIFYMIASMRSIPPWIGCDHIWASKNCVDTSNLTNIKPNITASMKYPTDDYFTRNVLNISSGIEELGDVQWHLALALLAAWLLIFAALSKGVTSLGKVSYFTAIYPYIMITALIIRCTTLDGCIDGILYYLKPEWEHLKSPMVWLHAATQVFYSLNIATGGVVAMASFCKFNNNILRDTLLVPFVNVLTSVYVGFAVFGVLGYMAHELGVDVKTLAVTGPGLVFIVYPEGLAQMSIPTMWSILFFLMMLTIGFGSELSIIETIMSTLIDALRLRISKKHLGLILRGTVCVVFLLVGLVFVTRGGIYVLTLVDEFISGIPILLISVLELLVCCYCYGSDRLVDDIEMMLKRKLPLKTFWLVCWKFLTPVVLLLTMILSIAMYEAPKYNKVYEYPKWAILFGWCVVIIPLLPIPIYALCFWIRQGANKAAFFRGLKPAMDWGPLKHNNRKGRYKTSSDDVELQDRQFTQQEFLPLETT